MAPPITPGAPGPVRPVDDLARYLLGEWHLARKVVDLTSGVSGWFVGSARVGDAGEGELVYREEGELVLGDYRGEARRAYRYVLSGPSSATVRFMDGRHFHELDLSNGATSVTHDCPPDRYRGRFCAHEDALVIEWRVEGPARDLLLSTTLSRAAVRARAPVARAPIAK